MCDQQENVPSLLACLGTGSKNLQKARSAESIKQLRELENGASAVVSTREIRRRRHSTVSLGVSGPFEVAALLYRFGCLEANYNRVQQFNLKHVCQRSAPKQ